MTQDFDTLNIVIAGGAAGLGLAVAGMMARRGVAGLAIIDRDEAGLEALAGRGELAGVRVHAVAGDISTSAGAHAAFGAAVAGLGRLHGLVNCAAVYPRKALLEISDEDWDLENAVNIKGTYHMMVAAVNHMKGFSGEGGIAGWIVNITSVDAFKAHPQNAHYAATKAAVVSLTRSFAHEFASDQILVNSVAPAGMATDKARAAGFLPELAAASPLKRAAEPDEIAEFVAMLASHRNTYMTGENVIVSGGYIYA
jgi:3-oxoacyl-[acyl-carrier protein] reductase